MVGENAAELSLSRSSRAYESTENWARGDGWISVAHLDWGRCWPLPVGKQALADFAADVQKRTLHGIRRFGDDSRPTPQAEIDALFAGLGAMDNAWEDPAGFPAGGLVRGLPVEQSEWTDAVLRSLPLPTRNFPSDMWLGLVDSQDVEDTQRTVWLFGTVAKVAREYYEFGAALVELPLYRGNREAHKDDLAVADDLLSRYQLETNTKRIKRRGRRPERAWSREELRSLVLDALKGYRKNLPEEPQEYVAHRLGEKSTRTLQRYLDRFELDWDELKREASAGIPQKPPKKN